jgi:hypothetical protein
MMQSCKSFLIVAQDLPTPVVAGKNFLVQLGVLDQGKWISLDIEGQACLLLQLQDTHDLLHRLEGFLTAPVEHESVEVVLGPTLELRIADHNLVEVVWLVLSLLIDRDCRSVDLTQVHLLLFLALGLKF